jgi:hypothetical protein
LVQNRHDGIYVLPKLPRRWKTLSFDGIRTEGAFFIGATVEEGKTTEVRVKSEKGGRLRLHPGFGKPRGARHVARRGLILHPARRHLNAEK